MKADYFNQKEYEELISALNIANPTQRESSQDKEEILKFFENNKEVDYNTFLTLYKEKYGNIIKQYREKEKVKAIKKIRFAATLYTITIFVGLAIGFIWFIIMVTE
jgi:hypothetical protein